MESNKGFFRGSRTKVGFDRCNYVDFFVGEGPNPHQRMLEEKTPPKATARGGAVKFQPQ